MKKDYFLGPVYKSTLIDYAIEKGEFTRKDLKEHLAFEVILKDEHLEFPFISAKIKYTQWEIVLIFDKFSENKDNNESKVMDDITTIFPWRTKESVKNFRKTMKKETLTLEDCFTKTYRESPYCFNYQLKALPH